MVGLSLLRDSHLPCQSGFNNSRSRASCFRNQVYWRPLMGTNPHHALAAALRQAQAAAPNHILRTGLRCRSSGE